MSTFIPKQALPRHAHLVTYISGDITEKIASKLLRLLPPITADSTIHDNACGSGAIAKAVMKSSPRFCEIHATDVNPNVVQELKAQALRNSWPLEVNVMAAEELQFEDEMFTHSINSFSIMLIERNGRAIEHVYRTLKHGGAALFSIWKDPILVQAVLAAHYATRPASTPVPPAVKRGRFDAQSLMTLLENSNFATRPLEWSVVEDSLFVEDLDHWLTATWSLLGQTELGWLQEDEKSWEHAIDVMMRTVQEWDGYEERTGRSALLNMKADVVVVVK